MTITFKNVGQGDSIIIEWDANGEKKVGIIDCNIINGKNPIYDYIVMNSITEIEFIILSHFHYDHFSGFSDVFKLCIRNNIRINWFYHTLSEATFEIYQRLFTSKKLEKAFVDFFDSLDRLEQNLVNDKDVNYQMAPIPLSESKHLTFLSPSIKTAQQIAKQVKRKVIEKKFSKSDINKFSTIACISDSLTDEAVLLTSDATKDSFKKILPKIKSTVKLIQVPHHGSYGNIFHEFWDKINKVKEPTAIFSIGDEPKDKLPDALTVEFIDSLKFNIHSTNFVYGIRDFYNPSFSQSPEMGMKSQYLDVFSKKIKTIQISPSYVVPPNLQGDQVFPF